jgi:hypothetical protein
MMALEAQREGEGWRRALRTAALTLFVLLLVSTVVTLFAAPSIEQAVREGRAPRLALVAAPALLASFIALFAAYRVALVRAGRYLAGKAFVQVGVMLLVFTLILPGSLDRWRSAGAIEAVDLTRHLHSADPEARALAAELVRHRERADALRHAPALIDLLDDGSPEVRRQARASLVAIAGHDVGGDDDERIARWREWWRTQR